MKMNQRAPHHSSFPSGDGSDIQHILKKPCFSEKNASDVHEMSRFFLKENSFSGFEHARVYDDGTCSILYSDLKVAKFVIQERIHITALIPNNIIRDSFWYLPPKDSIYIEAFKKLAGPTGVRSFIDYIRRHDGYYDMFCFTSSDYIEESANHFLNSIQDMEGFSLQFLDRVKDMISEVEKDRFTIPFDMRPNIRGLDKSLSASHDRISSLINRLSQEINELNPRLPSKLTNRELDCVRLMFLGHTAKEISSSLGVSVRTVEFYLDNIKSKLYCTKKSEIISTILAFATGSSLKHQSRAPGTPQ